MSDPTPQQRADYLVRKLENFIREGRSERGMSFKTWQTMARAELTNAFADFERRLVRSRQDRAARRLIVVGTTTVVTVGFWGATVVLDRHFGILAAWVCTAAGALLAVVGIEIAWRRMASRYKTIAREKSFERIEDFDSQLKRLETEIWRKLKKAKEKAEAGEEG
jgi:hypothetical protein